MTVFQSFSQPAFQLAPPLISYKSAFFSGSTSFEVQFNQPGASVHFTVDGREPTQKDKVYTGPVTIRKKTTVKLKAIGKRFQSSETVTATFIPEGKQITQVSFSPPNESYANAAPNILHDGIGGISNYRHGSWLGYNNDTATFDITLQKEETVREVLVSMLRDENSWIFLPTALKLFAFDEASQTFKTIASESFNHTAPSTKQVEMHVLKLPNNIRTSHLKIVVTPLIKIPDWHTGKGEHGWFFVDEIKVY
jgi:hypothetical protein